MSKSSLAMDNYLNEIEYAVTRLIDLMLHENNEANRIHSEIHRLNDESMHARRQSEFIALNAEDPEDVMMTTGMQWQAHADANQAARLVDDLREAGAREEAHRFSVAAIAGSVLQYAYQGVSLAFENQKITNLKGRMIGSQSIAKIITAGRHQANHWEERKLRPENAGIFDQLAVDFGGKFSHYDRGHSLASDVIGILEWNSFVQFKEDLTGISV